MQQMLFSLSLCHCAKNEYLVEVVVLVLVVAVVVVVVEVVVVVLVVVEVVEEKFSFTQGWVMLLSDSRLYKSFRSLRVRRRTCANSTKVLF